MAEKAKMKTGNFSDGRKLFFRGNDTLPSMSSTLPEGYDFGIETPDEGPYTFKRQGGSYVVFPGSFSQWRYLHGNTPYRRNYIDIDYSFNESNVFETYSDYFVPSVFGDYFPVWVNRGEFEYAFIYSNNSSIPDKVICVMEGEEVWSYAPAGARGASTRMILHMDNYIVFPTAFQPVPGTYYSGITILDYEGNVVYENNAYLGPYTNQNHPDADILYHTEGDTFYYSNNSLGTGARRILRVEDSTLVEVNTSVVEFRWWFGDNYIHTSPTGTYLSSPFDSVSKVDNETGEVIWENTNIEGVQLIQLNPYTDNVLISLYQSTYDGGVTYDDFSSPRLIELDGETGEILRNHVDAAADPENGFMQHGCFLSEKTFMYYDTVGDGFDVLEITFFDVETWTVRSKKTFPGYSHNNIRTLPLHFRNGVACFPIYITPNYTSTALFFVSESGEVNIVEGLPADTYTPPFTCTFDGKIVFSTGNRLMGYGKPRLNPPGLLVKSISFSNGTTLLVTDFGEDLTLEDGSLISLSGTVSGEITPLIIGQTYGFSRLYVEALTPISGETLTLTILPGAISGEFTNLPVIEAIVLTIEVP